ncbi:virion structural protein [Ralstonia phage RSL2]|uniref:Virion structural protein n=1 Tax=Ralstonia phage RSL2 TaxID=1585840 RepID=A0A0A8J987_9CAUD|nr:virion structural protein [Ralstonia phage RSL2]BAQ02593.1 hypothetical protein [Ralstonia phage RSL2]
MSDVTITPVSHVFDETGTLAENYIENEQRDLAQRNVRAACTRYGAFYIESFKIRDANGNPLLANQYQFGLFAEELSEKTGKEIAGAVIITDPAVISPVFMDYQCVGGPWGATNEQIIDLFTALMTDDRPVTWPNILGKPDGFKPAHHFQDIGDLFGAEYFVNALERLTNAYLMGDNASHDEILRNIDQLRQDMNQGLTDLSNALKAYADAGDARVQANLDNEAQIRAQADTTLQGNINAEATTRSNADTTLQNNINAAITHADNGDATLQQNINSEATARQNADTALNTSITSVNNALAAHVAAKGNVHSLTPAQLGVYTTAQVDALIAQINNQLTGYVKKNAGEDTSLTVSGGVLYGWVGGAWRAVWPPQWQ